MHVPEMIARIELDGGDPGLDFVNTLSSWVEAAPHDYWATPRELVAWHQHVGLVDAATADAFAALKPAAAGRLLSRARAARAQLHALFAGVAASGHPPAPALAWLDETLARLARFRHLQARGGAVRWVVRPQPGHPASLLAPALFAAGDLLTAADPHRIRACPPPEGCGWLFVDRSRGGRRVWCSMKNCGNAAKVRRFRKRAGRGGSRG